MVENRAEDASVQPQEGGADGSGNEQENAESLSKWRSIKGKTLPFLNKTVLRGVNQACRVSMCVLAFVRAGVAVFSRFRWRWVGLAASAWACMCGELE